MASPTKRGGDGNYRQTMREVFALRRNGYSGPFFVGMTLFLMGVWLMLPLETFSTSVTYSLMSKFAIEEFWGAIMSGTALIMVISALRRRPREVALGALVASFIWFLMASSFAAGNIASLSVPFSFVMTFRCLSIMREFKDTFDPVTGEPIFEDREGVRTKRTDPHTDEQE